MAPRTRQPFHFCVPSKFYTAILNTRICKVNPGITFLTLNRVVNFYLKIVREDSAILAMDLLPYVEGVTALSREVTIHVS